MKIILVSQRADYYPQRNEVRDALDQRLVRLVLFSGYIPIPIPNIYFSTEDSQKFVIGFLDRINCSGILLSGGNNIGDNLYRDNTEHLLLDYAERQSLPVLGICRGMQVMAHREGVELEQVKGHVRKIHSISGEVNKKIFCYHRFKICSCPKNYNIIAKSEDNVIEGIKHSFLNWEGWMWHPERTDKFCESDIGRIKRLFK